MCLLITSRFVLTLQWYWIKHYSSQHTISTHLWNLKITSINLFGSHLVVMWQRFITLFHSQILEPFYSASTWTVQSSETILLLGPKERLQLHSFGKSRTQHILQPYQYTAPGTHHQHNMETAKPQKYASSVWCNSFCLCTNQSRRHFKKMFWNRQHAQTFVCYVFHHMHQMRSKPVSPKQAICTRASNKRGQSRQARGKNIHIINTVLPWTGRNLAQT